ncbi:DUF5681 domain-containing protein [Xylella fastidiosa]|uniref:DUF5681 domain-containing protein n=2 Tax=Xylella fastidiosa TaxID=2371 RepID=UPI001F1A0F2A|nr:DUF5681 domain-containing protein [Xylella fastidiosa]
MPCPSYLGEGAVMAWAKGQSGNPKGRAMGSRNKNTAAIKQAFLDAFDQLGGVPALVAWARDNKTDFYKLAARMIPTEARVSGELELKEAGDDELDAAITAYATQAGISLVVRRESAPPPH